MLGKGESCAKRGIQQNFIMGDLVNQKRQQILRITILFGAMLVFRGLIDLAYWNILAGSGMYPKEFNPVKYALSLIWCVVLFLGIRHTRKKVSTFLICLMYLLQIVPISTIYALGNENSTYYHVLCLAFFICELYVGWTEDARILKRNTFLSNAMQICFCLVIIFVMVAVIVQNGPPQLIALDMSRVYELRGSGWFQLNKYIDYLMDWCVDLLIPLFIVEAYYHRKYMIALFFCGIQALLYLYTGHKSFFFTIFVAIFFAVWSRRKYLYEKTMAMVCVGMSVLCICGILAPSIRLYSGGIYALFSRSFSYLVRRCLLVPAVLKYSYFDYFSQHPKLGLAGLFPRWLIPIENPYAGISYPNEIGAIYLNSPETYANTGFLAEGYLRFGFVGIFLSLLLFGQVLKWIDSLQERYGYGKCIAILVLPVFSLADAELFNSLLWGAWMLILMYVAFYKEPEVSPLARRSILLSR